MTTPTFVAVTAQKGGVAKTTTAVSLAHHLTKNGSTVLLIDFDPQGNVATALGLDPMPGIFNLFIAEKPLANWLLLTDSSIEQENAEPITLERPRLLLLPGNQKTKLASSTLYMQIASGELVHADLIGALSNIGLGFDYVIMDTPASGIFQELALEIASTVIIPTELEQLSMIGVASTMATVAKLNQCAKIVILSTLVDIRITEHRYNFALLHESYSGLVSDQVPNCAAVKEATAQGRTIWEYEGKSQTLERVRIAYHALSLRVTEGGS